MSPPAGTPAARTTIGALLAEARAGLRRLTPEEARIAIGAGAVLIDIRSEVQRAADGVVPGALYFPRNVLEWRCDPDSPSHDARIGNLDAPLIVMCDEGYQSSLAAASLQRLGFRRATDLAGGFRAWRAAGLAVRSPTEGGAMRAVDCPCADAQIRARVAADAYDVEAVA